MLLLEAPVVRSHGSGFPLLQPLREDNGHEAEGVFPQFLSERLCQAQLQVVLPLFVVLGPAGQRGAAGRAEDTVEHPAESKTTRHQELFNTHSPSPDERGPVGHHGPAHTLVLLRHVTCKSNSSANQSAINQLLNNRIFMSLQGQLVQECTKL